MPHVAHDLDKNTCLEVGDSDVPEVYRYSDMAFTVFDEATAYSAEFTPSDALYPDNGGVVYPVDSLLVPYAALEALWGLMPHERGQQESFPPNITAHGPVWNGSQGGAV